MRVADFSGNGLGREVCAIKQASAASVQGTDLFLYKF